MICDSVLPVSKKCTSLCGCKTHTHARARANLGSWNDFPAETNIAGGDANSIFFKKKKKEFQTVGSKNNPKQKRNWRTKKTTFYLFPGASHSNAKSVMDWPISLSTQMRACCQQTHTHDLISCWTGSRLGFAKEHSTTSRVAL